MLDLGLWTSFGMECGTSLRKCGIAVCSLEES